MRFEKLENIIEDIDIKNKSGEFTEVLGVNIFKKFMPSVANLTNVDLSKYRIISKGQFATNIMHVDRDERLPIALYQNDISALVSPAYKVFGIKPDVEILPEYLMINFLKPEFDRYAWNLCDSSVRGGLEWYRFKEIKIPIIPLNEQKKYVSIYNSLLKNQACYENSLEDLQLICDGYIENLIKAEPKKRLGDYILPVDNRNTDLSVDYLRGISTNKTLIPTKANTTGVSFNNYKILNMREFAFVSDTSRRGDKIALAMNSDKPCIISSIYTTFKVFKENELLSEYLLLWFSRPEFDRYARYHSWGSARETFNWEDMCDVMLPIPDIEKQKAIVTIYHTLETRKKLNEKLKESLQPLCPILMKGVRDSINKN